MIPSGRLKQRNKHEYVLLCDTTDVYKFDIGMTTDAWRPTNDPLFSIQHVKRDHVQFIHDQTFGQRAYLVSRN